MIRIALALCTILTFSAVAPAASADDTLRDDGSLKYRFYTDWELLYVERDRIRDVEIGFLDPGAVPSPAFRSVLSADDVVDDDEEFGGRGVLGVRLDAKSAVEIVFTGFGHDRSATERSIPGEDLFAFELPDLTAVDDTAFDGAAAFDLEYDSVFYSGELNYRHLLEVPGADYRFNLLAGIRALRLEEDMDLTSIDTAGAGGVLDLAGPIGRFDIDTRNTLIGAQLGADALVPLWNDVIDFDLSAVVGAYANRADVRRTFFNRPAGGAPITRVRQSRSEWDVAGVIESAAHLTVRVYRGVKLKFGYRAIYLLNVAAAPDQYPATGSNGDFFGDAYDNDGKTIFHGPSLGVNISF